MGKVDFNDPGEPFTPIAEALFRSFIEDGSIIEDEIIKFHREDLRRHAKEVGPFILGSTDAEGNQQQGRSTD